MGRAVSAEGENLVLDRQPVALATVTDLPTYLSTYLLTFLVLTLCHISINRESINPCWQEHC